VHSLKSILILIILLLLADEHPRAQDRKLIENFADRIIKDSKVLDSLEVRFAKEGIRSIAEFLIDKDKDDFIELDRRAKSAAEVVRLATEIYDLDMMELAKEYFEWADERAKTGTGLYSFLETSHFLFYYPQEYEQDKISFISNESEKLYDSLVNIFEPDSSMIEKLNRLYTYESWRSKNFKQKTGQLKPTNGKFIIVLMNNRKPMQDIIGKPSEGWTLATTRFETKFVKEKNQVVYAWISFVPYFSAISLLPLVHEITHSFVAAIYSQPSLLEKYMTEHNLYDLSPTIPESVFVRSFMRPSILTIEGVAVWAGFEFTPFTRIGFLPSSRQAAQNAELPNLRDLLGGEVDVSLLGAIMGKVSKAMNNFFLSSGSFMGYMTKNYSPEQLKLLFTGVGQKISTSEIERICGKPLQQIEKEWHDWIKK